MQSNLAYINVDYKTSLHILWWPFKHEVIRLPHQIVFVLIFYFIGAILSKTKKCLSEELKKSFKERGTGRFTREGVFSKEGRIKSTHNAFTRKL